MLATTGDTEDPRAAAAAAMDAQKARGLSPAQQEMARRVQARQEAADKLVDVPRDPEQVRQIEAENQAALQEDEKVQATEKANNDANKRLGAATKEYLTLKSTLRANEQSRTMSLETSIMAATAEIQLRELEQTITVAKRPDSLVDKQTLAELESAFDLLDVALDSLRTQERMMVTSKPATRESDAATVVLPKKQAEVPWYKKAAGVVRDVFTSQ